MRWSLVALVESSRSISGIAGIPLDRTCAMLGVQPWPAAVGASEPLDCDEAAYA